MQNMREDWYIMTCIMPICFSMCIGLVVFQTRSLKWYSETKAAKKDEIFANKTELACLYGQYLIGCLCALQCFLCHISNLLSDLYCFYGMGICVIIYAGTKSCLYGFFIERAKCAQGIGIRTTGTVPPVVWRYVFPWYIGIYFLSYLFLCSLTFRGKLVDPRTNPGVPTACLFGRFYPWVFTLSALIDVFNSILFLVLFMYPLFHMLKTQHKLQQQQQKYHSEIAIDNDPQEETQQRDMEQIKHTMKVNVACSFICSISSATFLGVMSLSNTGHIGHYLWLGGNLDIMINSVCLFLMLGINRQYLASCVSACAHQINRIVLRGSRVDMENTDQSQL